MGEPEWRTNIPMTVFYSPEKKRAISFTAPIEIPTVRIRFLNNTSAEAISTGIRASIRSASGRISR